MVSHTVKQGRVGVAASSVEVVLRTAESSSSCMVILSPEQALELAKRLTDTVNNMALEAAKRASDGVNMYRDAVMAEAVQGSDGGYLVSLVCGHKIATRTKASIYHCRECAQAVKTV